VPRRLGRGLRLVPRVHRLDEQAVDAGVEEVVHHLRVLGAALGLARRQLGPVAVLQRRDGAEDQRVGAHAVARRLRQLDGETRQLRGAVAEALLLERSTMRAERRRHERPRPRLEVVAVNLLDHLRRLEQRPRRPERKRHVLPAPVQLRAGGAVDDQDASVVVDHGPSARGAGSAGTTAP
jgi:hypothetical protein